jgi:hypothetical protein
MADHWEEVRNVLDVLAYIVKDSDPDGLEFYFTISTDYKRSTNPRELLKLLHGKCHIGSTDINLRLNEIIDKYRAKLDKYKAKLEHGSSKISTFLHIDHGVRPLNLYILTDGIWEAQSRPDTIIINLVQKLLKLDKTRQQVGIQFISFGNNPIGLDRMRKLDSELGEGRKEEEWL